MIRGEIAVGIRGHDLQGPALRGLAGGRRDARRRIGVGRCADHHLIVTRCDGPIADGHCIVEGAGGGALANRRGAPAERLRTLT